MLKIRKQPKQFLLQLVEAKALFFHRVTGLLAIVGLTNTLVKGIKALKVLQEDDPEIRPFCFIF